MKTATFLEAGFPVLPADRNDFPALPNDPMERMKVYIQQAFVHQPEYGEMVRIMRRPEYDRDPRYKLGDVLNPVVFHVTVPVDKSTFRELMQNAFGSYMPKILCLGGINTPTETATSFLFILPQNSLYCE